MTILIIVIIVLVVIISLIRDYRYKRDVEKANKESIERWKREKEENRLKASALDTKYGTCTKSIKWWFDESTDLVRIYEDSKTIVIKNDAFSFSDIIGVDCIDKVQNGGVVATTKTNNANMVGRAVVGGLVAGGLGAAVGAVTAKQQTTYNNNDVHDYVILINTKKISKPLIEIRIGNRISQVNEVMATLNAVMAYN